MRRTLTLALMAASVIATGAFAGIVNSDISFAGAGDSGASALSIMGGGTMTLSGTVYVKVLSLFWVPINVNFSTSDIVLNTNPDPTSWTSDPTGTGQVGFDRGNPSLGGGTVNALAVDIKNGAAWNLAMDRITLTDPSNGFYKMYLDMTGLVNTFRFDMSGAPTGTYASGDPPTVTYDINPSGTLTAGYTTTMTGSLSLGFTFMGNWYSIDVPVGTIFNVGGAFPLPVTADGTMTLSESSGIYPHSVDVDIQASIGQISMPFGMSDSLTLTRAKSGNDPYYTLTGNYSFAGLLEISNTQFAVSDTIQKAVPDPFPAKLDLTVTNSNWGEVQIDPLPEDANTMLYPRGTTVTLTATPIEGKSFRQWTLYDPNYPDDANYATADANTSITLVLNQDTSVNAAFKCGSGVGEVLPLAGIGLLGVFFVRRRR